MTILLLLLATVAAGGVLGTIDAVRRDGYRRVPDRSPSQPTRIL